MSPSSRSFGPKSVFALSPAEREAKSRAHEAISLKRDHQDWTLSRAAREAGTTTATVRKYAADAIEPVGARRLGVKAADRGTRVMPLVSGGEVYPEVAIVGSRQAALVGGQLAGISMFLSTGDARPLRSFAGQTVSGTLPNGQRIRFELEADPDVIADLGFSGELSDLVIES
ncbi:MAG: hypothetical protein ACLQK4_10845 [Acidimicrobiales bacterium]|jgi:hypothetical protein